MSNIVVNNPRRVNNSLAMIYALAKECKVNISLVHDAVLFSGKKFDVERFKERIANMFPGELEFRLEQE